MISVIIPLYNKEHTIITTLECVLNQTYSDFEIVIVDDGSKDDGVQLIKDKFKDPRIRIISQSNQGVSAARNNGIKSARGEWLSFLDADDLWSNNYLELVHDAIIRFPDSHYIIGGRKVLNVINGSVFNFIPAKNHGKIEEISFFENPHVYCHISASTINKALLEQNKLEFIPGQKFHEDFTFTFQVALLSKTIFIGFPLVTYCGGVEGQTTSHLDGNVRLMDGCLFRNTVIHKWLNLPNKDKLLPIFMRYEIRHNILKSLLSKDVSTINNLMDGLSEEYKNTLFSMFEQWIYRNRFTRLIAVNWIRFTKILWRMHRFPRVEIR